MSDVFDVFSDTAIYAVLLMPCYLHRVTYAVLTKTAYTEKMMSQLSSARTHDLVPTHDLVTRWLSSVRLSFVWLSSVWPLLQGWSLRWSLRWWRGGGMLLVSLWAMFFGYAQNAPDPFADMEQLLTEGRYALATQVEGPALVTRLADEPYAHYLYAQALYLVGDIDAAQRALQAALANIDAVGDNDPVADREAARLPYLTLQGKLAAAQGEVSRAQVLLRDVFERQPSYTHASNWGQAAWQAADYDAALEAFRIAQDYATTTEETANVLLNRARLLRLSGQADRAVAVLENLLDILDAQVITELPPPAYAQAFLLLGAIYEDQGDVSRARANYEAARLADPNAVAATVALEQLPATP